MSTFSEMWHEADPHIRDFYRNYSRRHTNMSGKVQYLPAEKRWTVFEGIEWIFPAYNGWNLATGNWANQLSWWNWAEKNYVWWDLDPIIPHPPQQPIHQIYILGPYPGDVPDVRIAAPIYAANFPRAKYKARRHYWTGKPRRRLNYTGP